MQISTRKDKFHHEIREKQLNCLRTKIREQLLNLPLTTNGYFNQQNNKHSSTAEIQMNYKQLYNFNQPLSQKMERILMIFQDPNENILNQIINDDDVVLGQIDQQQKMVQSILSNIYSEPILDLQNLQLIFDICNNSVQSNLQILTNKCLQIISQTYFQTLQHNFRQLQPQSPTSNNSSQLSILFKIWYKCDTILIDILTQKYMENILTYPEMNFLITYIYKKIDFLYRYQVLNIYNIYISNVELFKIMLMITHNQHNQQIIWKILQTVLLMIHQFPQNQSNIFISQIVLPQQFIHFAQNYTNLISKYYLQSDLHLYNTFILIEIVQLCFYLLSQSETFENPQNNHQFSWITMLLTTILKHYYDYEDVEMKRLIAHWVILLIKGFPALINEIIIQKFYYDVFNLPQNSLDFQLMIIKTFCTLPIPTIAIMKQLQVIFQTKYLKSHQTEEDIRCSSLILSYLTAFKQKWNRQRQHYR